jgi:hypothetical protein
MADQIQADYSLAPHLYEVHGWTKKNPEDLKEISNI